MEKKEKISHQNIIADALCSNALKKDDDLSSLIEIAIENFFMFCDDADADVRIVADECLNRVIKVS